MQYIVKVEDSETESGIFVATGFHLQFCLV